MRHKEEYHVVERPREQPVVEQLRNFLHEDSRQNAIARTRRAEANAKALEAMLIAKFEEEENPVTTPAPVSPWTKSGDPNRMETEDYRSRLQSSLNQALALKSEISELLAQQESDNSIIESLQSSLERLHALIADYRKDKDEVDQELVTLLDTIRSSAGDDISSEEVKILLSSGALQVVGKDHLETAVVDPATEETIKQLEEQLAHWAKWSEQMTLEINEREDMINAKNFEIESLHRDIAEKGSLHDDLAAKQRESDELLQKLKGLEENLIRSRDELENVDITNQRLSAEKNELQVRVDSLMQQFDETTSLLKLRISQLEEEIATQPQATCDHEQTMNEMETKLQEWSAWADEMTNELSAREQEIEEIKQERTSTVNQMELELNSATNRLLESEETSSRLTVELESLQEQLRSALATPAADLEEPLSEARVSELKSRVSWSPEELAELSKTELLVVSESLKSDSSVMEKKLEEWQSWSAETTEELSHSNREKKLLEIRVLELEEEVQTAEHERRKSKSDEAELRVLRGENDLLKLQIESLSSSLNDVSSPRAADEDMIAMNRELETKISEWAVWADEVTVTLAEKDQIIKDLETKLVRAETSSEEIGLLRAKIDQLMDENEMLTSLPVDKAKEDLQAKLKEWQHWADDTNETLKIRDDEILNLRAQLENSAKASDVSEMQVKLDEWSKWAETMTADLQQRDALLRERDQEIESLRAEVVQVDTSDQLDELKSLVVQLRAELEEKEFAISSLTKQVTEIPKSPKSPKKSENEAVLWSKLAVRDATIKALTAVHSLTPPTEETASDTQIETLKQRVFELENSANQEKDDKASLEQKMSEWTQWAEGMTSQLRDRDAEIETLRANAATGDAAKLAIEEKQELEKKIFEWSEWAESVTAQLREKDDMIAQLSSRSPSSQSPRDSLTKTHEEIEALKQTIAKLNSAPRDEEAEILVSVYRQEVDRLSKENSELRAAGTAGKSEGWWKDVVAAPFLAPDDEQDKPNEI